jgi:hypothetical protein
MKEREAQPLTHTSAPQVPKDKRINRVTTSIFQFKEGGVGTLTHTALLHEATYHTAFEILADGLHMLIEDPYDKASLTVRRPHSETYEKVTNPAFTL